MLASFRIWWCYVLLVKRNRPLLFGPSALNIKLNVALCMSTNKVWLAKHNFLFIRKLGATQVVTIVVACARTCSLITYFSGAESVAMWLIFDWCLVFDRLLGSKYIGNNWEAVQNMTNKQEVVGGERGMKQSKLLPSPGHNDSSFDNNFLHVKATSLCFWWHSCGGLSTDTLDVDSGNNQQDVRVWWGKGLQGEWLYLVQEEIDGTQESGQKELVAHSLLWIPVRLCVTLCNSL